MWQINDMSFVLLPQYLQWESMSCPSDCRSGRCFCKCVEWRGKPMSCSRMLAVSCVNGASLDGRWSKFHRPMRQQEENVKTFCVFRQEKSYFSLDVFEKCLDEFVKRSRRVFPFVLIGTTWHYLIEAALYCKFDKNKCHVSYGLCTNALCWTHSYFLPSHPVQSFEAFLKGKIHSLHHIFLSFSKFETWYHFPSNLYGEYIHVDGCSNPFTFSKCIGNWGCLMWLGE